MSDVAAPEGRKKLILIVDDDPDLCVAVSEILLDAGYDCQRAHDGTQALDLIAREYTLSQRQNRSLPPRLPNLILLDWLMPRMDGFGFMGALRANPKYRDIPVVVISGVALEPEDAVVPWVVWLPKLSFSEAVLLEVVAREAR